jgi:tetratricopeptide (TPR) repeat protein
MHADLLAFAGTMHWYQGQLDQAQAGFDAAQQVLLRTQKLAPNDTTLLFQFATLDNNAGHVLEGRGDVEGASVHYRRMLATTRKLVAISPGNKDWQTHLGLAHNNLAKMALLNGDLKGAVAGYGADLQIEERLAALDPRNNAQAEKVLLSRAALGRTLALTGALDEGADGLQQAYVEAQRLSAGEPNSAGFREDVTLYATQLARLRRLQGRLAEAKALAADALENAALLLKTDAGNASWQRMRAEALAEQSRQADSAQAAQAQLRQALAILDPQLAANIDDRGALLATGGARLQLDALSPVPQSPALREALAACDAQKSGRGDLRLRALRAELLFRLGDKRAPAEAAQVWRNGYRDLAFGRLLRDQGVDASVAVAGTAGGAQHAPAR